MKPERVMKNAINIRKQVREKGEAKLRKWDMFGDPYYYDPKVTPKDSYSYLEPVLGKGNVGITSKLIGRVNTVNKTYLRKDPKLKKRLKDHLKKNDLDTFVYSKSNNVMNNPMHLFARKEVKLANAGHFGESVIRLRKLLQNNQDIARSNGFDDEYGRRLTRELDAKRMAEMRDNEIARKKKDSELGQLKKKRGFKNKLVMLFKKR